MTISFDTERAHKFAVALGDALNADVEDHGDLPSKELVAGVVEFMFAVRDIAPECVDLLVDALEQIEAPVAQ